MALRRQGLAQRRKAVGLTQEALAQRLGVERSTVVRWEAGDTEPLPSIRPHVAAALQLSLDQLAALLTEDENAGTTKTLPAGTDVTIPLASPAVLPSREECEDLVPPQVTEAFEALRRALRSAGVSPEGVDAPLLASKSSPDTAGGDVGTGTLVPMTYAAGGLARSDLPEPARTEVLRRPFPTAIPLDVEPADARQRQATSRRFKRLAAAGILAFIFAGGAASVPFMTSRSGPIPPTGAGNPLSPVPAAPVPAPNVGSDNDSSRPEGSTAAIDSAPAGAPGTPVGEPALPAAAAVPAPHTIRASNPQRTTSRPKSPASAGTRPAPRTPPIPAEAYAWSEMAAASASDHRARIRPEVPPHP
ncbi:MAG: helix-turn-helix domain-containing protein [Actinomycetota bacterium]|nr:helix-turn-helix domain-containing protein [Actinomycetota bacterium]